MAIDSFETYTCDVCKRKQEFEREFSIKQQQEKKNWRWISCIGVCIDTEGDYIRVSVPFGEHDPRLVKFLVCEDEQCLEAAFSRIIGELRLSFAEEKQKLARS